MLAEPLAGRAVLVTGGTKSAFQARLGRTKWTLESSYIEDGLRQKEARLVLGGLPPASASSVKVRAGRDAHRETARRGSLPRALTRRTVYVTAGEMGRTGQKWGICDRHPAQPSR